LFNTNTLGYKLISGQLKENRNHSEQLNKFLAGLIDSDGYISADFCRNRLQIQCGLLQSASNDPDFIMLRSIKEYFSLGTLIYSNGDKDTHLSTCRWVMRTKDSKILFNRIGKHLRIKGTHFDNIVSIHDDIKDLVLTDNQIEDLRAYLKCSRDNSRWLKQPKHPSWSWLAGYLAGDGHFEFRQRIRGEKSNYNLRVSAVANEKDIHVLHFIQKAFKGNVARANLNPEKPNYNNYTWRRGLGKKHKMFSISFLRKLSVYMCLYKKYYIINEMVSYLEQDAKTKQCVNAS